MTQELNMSDIKLEPNTCKDHTIAKRNIIFEDFLIQKVTIAEDDRLEYPVLAFKSR